MLSPQTEKLSSSCPKPQMASVMFSGKWIRVGFIEVCSRKSIGGSSLIRMSSRPRSTVLLEVTSDFVVSSDVDVNEDVEFSTMVGSCLI